MNVKFSEVKKDLAEIKAKLSEQEITRILKWKWQLTAWAYTDEMKLKSSNEIQSRTVKLHDQLDLFMLGVANTFPDLMKTVRDLYDVSYHLKYKLINSSIINH